MIIIYPAAVVAIYKYRVYDDAAAVGISPCDGKAVEDGGGGNWDYGCTCADYYVVGVVGVICRRVVDVAGQDGWGR